LIVIKVVQLKLETVV